MLYTISGRLAAKRERFAVVEVGGLGLRVFMNPRGIGRLPAPGSDVKLFSHLYVREDMFELYGFLTAEERSLFEALNSVAGVGPKSALSVLEIAELPELSAAIKEGRPDLLTRASGIGRKTAERIILELKGKVEAEASEAAVARMESDADIVETLSGLGYRKEEARAALEKVGEGVSGLEARLKAALKVLANKK
jgi:Holliday junction DNA helicase RuvA